MIVVLAVLFRRFLRTRQVEEARRQADRGVAGSMEGHAAMDMSVPKEGPLWRRLTSPRGFTAVSHIFVMEWAAVLRDIVGGLLIAGAVGAWVPDSFWQGFFLTDHPLVAKIWGPIRRRPPLNHGGRPRRPAARRAATRMAWNRRGGRAPASVAGQRDRRRQGVRFAMTMASRRRVVGPVRPIHLHFGAWRTWCLSSRTPATSPRRAAFRTTRAGRHRCGPPAAPAVPRGPECSRW